MNECTLPREKALFLIIIINFWAAWLSLVIECNWFFLIMNNFYTTLIRKHTGMHKQQNYVYWKDR